ncbi:MAG: NADPH-dependent 7-cyano-7-deazaguanine reductase QueF [Gammaproteobacteria bacterium]
MENPLGQRVTYTDIYQPDLLCSLPRAAMRQALGIGSEADVPFQGVDIWTCYEVSWLNGKGKPDTAVVEIQIPCASEYMVESKSVKLYLNSLNGTRFDSCAEVIQTIASDVRVATRSAVVVKVVDVSSAPGSNCCGTSLDDLDLDITEYTPNPELLRYDPSRQGEDVVVTESVYSHLFKTNCPVTGQPDWATIYITYQGAPIDKAALLRYLISYRRHQGYHEQSVEQIYMDVTQRLQPACLTVFARYTRRGGIDINPFRSNFESAPTPGRTFRQ